MAKSAKALEDLKKLIAKQGDINKQVLAASKAYAAELKAEAGAKPAKAPAKKPARKVVAKKAGKPRGRKPSAKKPAESTSTLN